MADNLPDQAKKLQIAEQSELARIEEAIAAALNAIDDQMMRVKMLIVRVRDLGLYRADYDSLEDYAQRRWDISLRTLQRWIDQGRAGLAIEASVPDKSAGQPTDVTRASPPSQRAIARARKVKAIPVESMEVDSTGAGKLNLTKQGNAQDSNTKRGPQSGTDPSSRLEGHPAETIPATGPLDGGQGPRLAQPEASRDGEEPGAETVTEADGEAQTEPSAEVPTLVAACKRILIADGEELAPVGRDLTNSVVVHLRQFAFRPIEPRERRKEAVKQSDCRHPVGARLGSTCMDCGASLAKVH